MLIIDGERAAQGVCHSLKPVRATEGGVADLHGASVVRRDNIRISVAVYIRQCTHRSAYRSAHTARGRNTQHRQRHGRQRYVHRERRVYRLRCGLCVTDGGQSGNLDGGTEAVAGIQPHLQPVARILKQVGQTVTVNVRQCRHVTAAGGDIRDTCRHTGGGEVEVCRTAHTRGRTLVDPHITVCPGIGRGEAVADVQSDIHAV